MDYKLLWYLKFSNLVTLFEDSKTVGTVWIVLNQRWILKKKLKSVRQTKNLEGIILPHWNFSGANWF